jgi:hypothetical protein
MDPQGQTQAEAYAAAVLVAYPAPLTALLEEVGKAEREGVRVGGA